MSLPDSIELKNQIPSTPIKVSDLIQYGRAEIRKGANGQLLIYITVGKLAWTAPVGDGNIGHLSQFIKVTEELTFDIDGSIKELELEESKENEFKRKLFVSRLNASVDDNQKNTNKSKPE